MGTKYKQLKEFELHLAKEYSGANHCLLIAKDPWQRQLAEERLCALFKGFGVLYTKRGISKVEEVAAECEGLDLFGGERLLVLTADGETMSKSVQSYLVDYLVHRRARLSIALSLSSLSASTQLYKTFEAYGTLYVPDVLKPKEREQCCAQWLIELAALAGKQMHPNAAGLLVRQLGVDYGMLKGEVEKLIAYVGERSSILQADVEVMSPEIIQEAVWQIGDLLLQRDGENALKMGYRLLLSGSPFIGIVRQIRKQFQTALDSVILSSEEISRRYPLLRDFMIDRYQRLAGGYGRKALLGAICVLDSSELAFKNGCYDEELLLQQLVVRLIVGIEPKLKLPIGAFHAS